MRKILATLTLLLSLWVAAPALAQSPVNGQTNIPNWLWVKPTVVDRTQRAFCLWGGMSLSVVNACDTPLIDTDGSISTVALKLEYQLNTSEPSFNGLTGLWWETRQANTWDYIDASTDTGEHTLLIESRTDTGGTATPYVMVRAESTPGGVLAQTTYSASTVVASSSITHNASQHVFDNLATFVNIRVSTDSDLRGDVFDGVGTFTIADNAQVNGFLDLYNGGPISSTTASVTIDDALVVTGDISDSNSDVTVNDGLIVTGSISDSNSAVTVADDFTISGGDITFNLASSVGSINFNDQTNTTFISVRPASGKNACMQWTEDSVADRWSFYTAGGSALLQVKAGSCSGTTMWEWDAAGNITTDQTSGTITFGDSTNKFETMFLSLDGIASGIVDVVTNSTGELFYDSSTRNIKKHIENHTPKKAATLAIQPRLYRDVRDADDAPKTLGLIAEEIPAELQPELVTRWNETRYDDEGVAQPFEVVAVNYKKLAILLLEVVKGQEARLVALEARVAALEKKP